MDTRKRPQVQKMRFHIIWLFRVLHFSGLYLFCKNRAGFRTNRTLVFAIAVIARAPAEIIQASLAEYASCRIKPANSSEYAQQQHANVYLWSGIVAAQPSHEGHRVNEYEDDETQHDANQRVCIKSL